MGVLLLASCSLAQQPPTREQTATEILYRGRYTNCDAAYAVMLPAGIVAHRDKSTAVNHGFTADLSAPGDTRPMSRTTNRYVEVSNLFNSTGLRSLDDVADDALRREAESRSDFDVVEHLPVKLAGLPAIHYRARFKNREKMVAEGIIAFRLGERGHPDFIYRLQLVSAEAAYPDDKRVFDRLTAGFRLQDFGAPCE